LATQHASVAYDALAESLALIESRHVFGKPASIQKLDQVGGRSGDNGAPA
jgi:hypothetical protein